MRTLRLPVLAVGAGLLAAAACASHATSTGASSGPTLSGAYTSDDAAAAFRAVVFPSATAYFAYKPGCGGADDGCRSQGTYTVDAASATLTLTDGDTGEVQSFPLSIAATTTIDADDPTAPQPTVSLSSLHPLDVGDGGLLGGGGALVQDAGGGLVVASKITLVTGTHVSLLTRVGSLLCGSQDWAVDDCSAQGAYAASDLPADGGVTSPAPPVGPACGCGPISATSALRFDPLGYATTEAPHAVWVGTGTSAPPQHLPFQVLDGTGAVVASGATGDRVFSGTSMALTAPKATTHEALVFDPVALAPSLPAGDYTVVIGASATAAGRRFGPLHVGDGVYAGVLPAVLGFLREQRCGNVDASSLHAACHLHAYVGTQQHSGDGVAVPALNPNASQEETTPTAIAHGASIDAEGGWHDAGDYIKFLGTSAYVIAVELVALRDHPTALAGARTGNVASTLKTEMRWGLDWVVKMVGGPTMYHQVSGPQDHNVDNRVPSADATFPQVWKGGGDDDTGVYAQRPVFPFRDGYGANFLGRAAAALALGAQVFAGDDPAYSASLLTLAKTVFAQALARQMPQTTISSDFYPEDTLADDLTFGAAELSRASTGSDVQMYASLANTWGNSAYRANDSEPIAWGTVHVLALREAALAFPSDDASRQNLSSYARAMASAFVTPPAGAPGTAFGYPLGAFGNNSIPDGLGAAAACLAAYDVGGDAGCVQVARDTVHWLFGQNPFGASFVVGLGAHYPKHPQHAFSQAAHKQLNGMIVGGPTAMSVLVQSKKDDGPDLHLPVATDPYAPYSTSSLVYDDNATDFVTSEAGIDYTAALVYILADLSDM